MTRESTKFLFVGGHPLIDFVNTRIISGGKRVELLEQFADFTLWLKDAGLIGETSQEILSRRWEHGKDGNRFLTAVVHFRDQLELTLQRMVKGASIPHDTLLRINEILREGAGYLQIENSKSGFVKTNCFRFEQPIHLLAPVANAAADFLTLADASLVKKCENPRCILYFYDETKNRTRRWCSMQVCGNRMKAARHYKKTHRKPRRRKTRAL